MSKFIAYYRVSTDRQGRSGLGLEAQRAAVTGYLNGHAHELGAEFVEIESGKLNERPQLSAAIAAARKTKATLVIAKLDRLSRNVAFIAALMDAGVDFIAVDNPNATRLTLHILAAVAEHEREMISARTRAALAAARERGTRLGTHDPIGAIARMGEAARAKATAFAANILPLIRDLQAAGHKSAAAIANQLNARQVATARGGRWTHVQVGQILQRA
jgi:DNA invertase Pin-like site-specific DNA recombinase